MPKLVMCSHFIFMDDFYLQQLMGSRIYLHVHVSRIQTFASNFAVFGIVLTFFFHFEKVF